MRLGSKGKDRTGAVEVRGFQKQWSTMPAGMNNISRFQWEVQVWDSMHNMDGLGREKGPTPSVIKNIMKFNIAATLVQPRLVGRWHDRS